MAKRIQVAVDCADPERLARFWADALGYRLQPPPDGYADWAEFSRAVGEPDERWAAVVDPAGAGPRVLFHRVPEAKTVKNRLHLDVFVTDPGSPDRHALVGAEVERLIAAGATHVRTVQDETDHFAVLLDPEGNEFCVC